MDILKEIELHGHAGRNAGSSGGQGCAIAEAATGRTERSGSGVLNGEGHTVGAGVDELEGEVVGEALHIDGCGEPGAAGLGLSAIVQLKRGAIQLGVSIKLKAGGGKSGREIDGGRAALN